MAGKTPQEGKSPHEEVDYNETDTEDDDVNGAEESAPNRITPNRLDANMAPKGAAYDATARELKRKHEQHVQANEVSNLAATERPGGVFFRTGASAAGKQPEGSDAVDETGPGALAYPLKAPAVEVSDDADPGGTNRPDGPS